MSHTNLGRLLVALADSGLPFILIGGLALGPHGAGRATVDVDILVPSDRERLAALRDLLTGPLSATRPDGSLLGDSLFDGEHDIHALTAHGPLDVVIERPEPLSYQTLREDAVIVHLEGREIAVVGLAGLVALKRLAGRPLDREDVRRLADAHGELPE